ncbi:hypothetical protein ASPBRDRAFT_25208 [Aspergillus brasiliensis CBS 101740]|uniref:non-specific serine/threonine protein kinase n=1 Tax=Aspergillus brasiliensis (strain CBS 101740 / IMI 381727 / IBT 21946) TaxID=767769 RepID=A0A1L9V0X5_ASPBC|nr:hypothetical protein ASPBRDRAFT_25208 [Aspergillus brasiliensis CBS 101740]
MATKLKQLDIIIENRYKLINFIASGTFGAIYEAIDLQTNERLALKMERAKDSDSLTKESEFYEKLQESRRPGMLKLHFSCRIWNEYRVMGLELLGPSLWDLKKYCGGRFSLKTVLLIVDQVIPRLKAIHDKGIIHRDLKPDNLIMGRGPSGNTLYLVDMGVAREKVQAPDDPMDYEGDKALSLVGTQDYAPRAAHQLRCQTYRDDMESLGYLLIEFLNDRLPWTYMTTTIAGQTSEERMARSKERITLDTLCAGLPKAFKKYFEHVNSLRYNQRPNYYKLQCLFRSEFVRQGFHHDFVFDWTEQRFGEPAKKAAEEAAQKAAEEEYESFSSSTE